MPLPTVPSYPAPVESAPEGHEPRFGRSRRQFRLLRNLGLLVVFAVSFHLLKKTADSIEHPMVPGAAPPLDFRLVEERYHRLRRDMTREEVESVLGLPGERNSHRPELRELEAWAFRSWRRDPPRFWVWDLWVDPADQGRWVAVLYTDNARVFDHYFYSRGPRPRER